MGLSAFEIAIGGITSVPVLGSLIFLGYKAFGEKNLDNSKLKTKKPAAGAASAGVAWNQNSLLLRIQRLSPQDAGIFSWNFTDGSKQQASQTQPTPDSAGPRTIMTYADTVQ